MLLRSRAMPLASGTFSPEQRWDSSSPSPPATRMLEVEWNATEHAPLAPGAAAAYIGPESPMPSRRRCTFSTSKGPRDCQHSSSILEPSHYGQDGKPSCRSTSTMERRGVAGKMLGHTTWHPPDSQLPRNLLGGCIRYSVYSSLRHHTPPPSARSDTLLGRVGSNRAAIASST